MCSASVVDFSLFFFLLFLLNKRAVLLLSFGLHCTKEMESLSYLSTFFKDIQILRENV